MKIEKLNDQQIRCTLTKEDLAQRKIQISELAYGSPKARSLFQEMMNQAAEELGFEINDYPLMIEAVPVNAECLVLLITKVEDPEELDTRFAKFAPSVHSEIDADDADDDIEDLAEKLSKKRDQIRQFVQDTFRSEPETNKATVPTSETQDADKTANKAEASGKKVPAKKAPATSRPAPTQLYEFDSIHSLTTLASLLKGRYNGDNTLYKAADSVYLLLLNQSDMDIDAFMRVCNVMSEYGRPILRIQAAETYLEEHYEPLIRGNALQSLGLI